jgi:hypothetical protein
MSHHTALIFITLKNYYINIIIFNPSVSVHREKLRNPILLQNLSQTFGSEQVNKFFREDFQQKVIACKVHKGLSRYKFVCRVLRDQFINFDVISHPNLWLQDHLTHPLLPFPPCVSGRAECRPKPEGRPGRLECRILAALSDLPSVCYRPTKTPHFRWWF